MSDEFAKRFKAHGDVADAINHLKAARDALVRAGAIKAAERVRAALKSAEGAERHASRMRWQAHASLPPAARRV